MSKIKQITISNLKAVKKFTGLFEGATAIITGGNNKGKTSILRSLPDRLRGIKPGIILSHDEKEGYAEWTLTSGEKFIWTFDKKKEKLTYITERNISAAVTKEISNNYFPAVFDVDKFLNDAPAKQKATLQKLSGLDFTDIDNAYKLAYEQRTYANKRRDEEKVRHESNLPDPGIKETNTDKLEQEIAGIETHNFKYIQVERGIEQRNASILEWSTEIAELEKKILALQEKKIKAESEIKSGNTWMQIPVNKPKNNKAELQAKLDAIKKNNEAVATLHQYKLVKDQAAEADQEVKKIEADKLEMIRLANLPEGFGFDEDGITYNGFSFNKQQLSSSGIYIAALKLAALQLGEVKTLFFDASYLDNKSLAEVEKWAVSQGLQLLIEMPDRSGGEITYEIIKDV